MPATGIGGRVNVAQRPARGRRKRLGRYTDAMAADDVRFEIMTSIADAPAVVAMMNGLYDEDPASGRLDRGRFGRTIEIFLAQPQRGSVMLIRVRGDLAGYALLVPYFSNELGGVILFIDELFVLPPHRGRGLDWVGWRSLQRCCHSRFPGCLLRPKRLQWSGAKCWVLGCWGLG